MEVVRKFWSWYGSHKTFNTGLAASLFVLQLGHLYWMTAHVVAFKLFGHSYFSPTGLWEAIIILVDYTEIPAIVLTSLVYINEFRERRNAKSILYLFLLNAQWIHIFWITDEVVLEQFTNITPIVFPVWLSWLAIGIDYLELPVIYDTIKKFFVALLSKQASEEVKVS
ncbi:MAG: hypothetical protein NUV54_00525 [Candidatus Taylorbacteria bacterium]|nr:hypothetical protein [Candidatus Taylorbacteria bacterium]